MNKEILVTDDYSQFKEMEGNRTVEPARINKIIKSINKVGYITSPIIVNENMEVIDGQGRLKALETLKLPVEYIVHSGIGIDECISMNIHQTNWKIQDYIKSYSDRGNSNYRLLVKLMEKYKNFNLEIFATATNGTGRFDSNMTKNGNLVLTDESFRQAEEKLEYLEKFLPYLKQAPGTISALEQAIIICFELDEIDKDRLLTQICKYIRLMIPWKDVPGAMQSIEDLYNRNISNKVYIYTLYRVRQDERMKLYKNKYWLQKCQKKNGDNNAEMEL